MEDIYQTTIKESSINLQRSQIMGFGVHALGNAHAEHTKKGMPHDIPASLFLVILLI